MKTRISTRTFKDALNNAILNENKLAKEVGAIQLLESMVVSHLANIPPLDNNWNAHIEVLKNTVIDSLMDDEYYYAMSYYKDNFLGGLKCRKEAEEEDGKTGWFITIMK